MVINEMISALLQIIAFSLIPLLVYLIRKRSFSGFFEFIGLIPTTSRAIKFALFTSLLFVLGGVLLAIVSQEIREIITTPPSIAGKIKSVGLSPDSILMILIIACFKTSLSEEILFRGFIGKRLISLVGFQKGNLIQSLIFASIHVILFWLLAKASIAFLIFIFLLSGTAGYVIEYINETKGDGSILPGWVAHALGNAVSYFVLAFVI